MYPIHEKVFLPYEVFKNMFMDMYNSLVHLKILENMGVMDITNTRYLLADNREVKKFLWKDIQKRASGIIPLLNEEERLLQMDMPHYLWVCEVAVDTGYIFFFADPTYARVTTKNIFINNIPIMCEDQFGLLNY